MISPFATVSLWQKPNLVRFLTVRVLMAFAAQMQDVAIGWHVYAQTGSAMSLGLVGLVQFLPLLLLVGLSGDLADRVDRRRISVFCNLAQMICSVMLFIFAFFTDFGIWPIYLCLFGLGSARAFSAPAMSAILPNLVDKTEFSRAVAVNSSAFQIATIVGPAAGGLLYAFMGHATFLVSALFFGIAGATVSTLPSIIAKASEAHLTTLQRVLAGARYVFSNKIVLGALSLDLFAVLLGGVTALLPIYAHDILNVGPGGLGFLRGCPAIGAALMGACLAYIPLKRNVGALMFLCVAGYGLATIVFAFSTSLMVSAVSMIALGVFDMVSVVVRQTLVQIATPDAMRGRVTAINFVFIGASNQLGEFESGFAAHFFGVVPAALLGGVGTLFIVATWAWLFPQLRKADRFEN
jgi:MFS family permease